MEINRPALKSRAKMLTVDAKPSPILVGLVYLALAVVISLLSYHIMGLPLSEEMLRRYTDAVTGGNLDYAYHYLMQMMPGPSAYAINLALQIVLSIVSAGFTLFLLNTVRRTGACFGNLLDGFGMFGRILLLNILEYIFISLWSLLFLFPGLIAAYRYRMALYLLLDHPEMSVMQCIRESKQMMAGHKWELFVMDLSFLGWNLLGFLPALGYVIQIWTTPYISMSYVLYYEALRGTEGSHDAGNGGTWRETPPWEG